MSHVPEPGAVGTVNGGSVKPVGGDIVDRLEKNVEERVKKAEQVVKSDMEKNVAPNEKQEAEAEDAQEEEIDKDELVKKEAKKLADAVPKDRSKETEKIVEEVKEKSAPVDPTKIAEASKEAEKEASVGKKPVWDASYAGWKEVARWTENDRIYANDDFPDLLSRKTIFEILLPDKLYGDWYHNTGFYVLFGLISWIIGRFGGGLNIMFFVFYLAAVLYRVSIRKYRRTIRALVANEFSVRKMETEFETIDWLNYTLTKLWFFAEPYVSKMVCDIANPMMVQYAPGFIQSMGLDTFTVGTKPPRIDGVKTFTNTEPDVVVMDWKLSFTPNDLADAPYIVMKNNVNQKVVVAAKMFGITVPVTVKDLAFKVRVRVRVRLMTAAPHVQTVAFTLMDKPYFDFVAKPLVGDSIFGGEVLALPGLKRFIEDMAEGIAGPMLYNPYSYSLNVPQLLSGSSDVGIGVFIINIKSAKDLKGANYIGASMDPFIEISIGRRTNLESTSVKQNTRSPVWNETKMVVAENLTELLTFELYDYNEVRKNDLIGIATLPLAALAKKPVRENLSLPLMLNNKSRGDLILDIKFAPTEEEKKQEEAAKEVTAAATGAKQREEEAKKAEEAAMKEESQNEKKDSAKAADESTEEKSKEESQTEKEKKEAEAAAEAALPKSGIFKFGLANAKNLKCSKSAKSFATAYLDGKELFTTSMKKGDSPVWDFEKLFVIKDKSKSKFKIVVSGAASASLTISAEELLERVSNGDDWFEFSNGAGTVKLSAHFTPVDLNV